jgi:hypothetical protein
MLFCAATCGLSITNTPPEGPGKPVAIVPTTNQMTRNYSVAKMSAEAGETDLTSPRWRSHCSCSGACPSRTLAHRRGPRFEKAVLQQLQAEQDDYRSRGYQDRKQHSTHGAP